MSRLDVFWLHSYMFLSLSLWCMACVFTIRFTPIFLLSSNCLPSLCFGRDEENHKRCCSESKVTALTRIRNTHSFFHATSILTFISSGKVDWAHTLHFFINYTPKLSCPVKPVLFCMLFSLACTQGTLRVFYWEVQVTLINMSHPSISILSNFPWSKFQGYQVILV